MKTSPASLVQCKFLLSKDLHFFMQVAIPRYEPTTFVVCNVVVVGMKASPASLV